MTTSRRAAVLAIALAGCTPVATSFHCTTDDQCALASRAGGLCESNGVCSFPDSLCAPSSRRYRAGCSDACVGGGAVRLHGLHPEAAAPGDTVFLEGTFSGGDLRVLVPTAGGDRSVVPTRVGARLSVQLPDDAVRGTVRVSSGDCPSDRLPLEIVNRNATLGDFATRTQSLPSEGHAVVHTGRRLFSFGGTATEVDVADVKGDGDLAPFAPVDKVILSFTHHRGCALFLGDRILVLGGDDGGTPSAQVEELLLSKYPSPFTKTGRLLTQARQGHHCAAIGPWIYVFGGFHNNPSNGNATTSVERARIVDGKLGDFEDAGIALERPRGDFGLVVAGTQVHAFGGVSDDTSASLLRVGETATISSDGSLGAFALRTDDSFMLSGFSFQILLEFGTLVASRDVYLVGGFSAGNYLDLVAHAPLTSSDDITPFTRSAIQLKSVRLFPSALVVGGRVWVFGGVSSSGARLGSIESATLQ